MSDAPDEIENALETILSNLDRDNMSAEDRMSVEHNCQKIHAIFGGDGPEDIYPDE